MTENGDARPARALEADALSVWRGGRKVLDRLSLHLERAEVLAIVGPSGSGKSSLLYALAGLIPYEGSIRRPDRIGVVFQDHGVFPWLTAAGNIGFGIRALPREQRTAIVDELLQTCGLREVAQRYPQQLSGGQRQRVAVARALAQRTRLLLLDEPFASLDVVTRVGLHSWLKRLVDELGVSIVIVTHDIEDAVRLSDRILVLVNGQIAMQTSGNRTETGSKARSGRDVEMLRQSLVAAMSEDATSTQQRHAFNEGVSVG